MSGSRHIASLMKGTGTGGTPTPTTTPTATQTAETPKPNYQERNPRQRQQHNNSHHQNRRPGSRQQPSDQRVLRNPVVSTADQEQANKPPAQAIVSPFPQQGQPIFSQTPTFSPRVMTSFNSPDQLRFGLGRGRGRGYNRFPQGGLLGAGSPQLPQNNALMHNLTYQNQNWPYYHYAGPINQPYSFSNPRPFNMAPSNRHFFPGAFPPPAPFPFPRPPYIKAAESTSSGAQSEKVASEPKLCTHETHDNDPPPVSDNQLEEMDKLLHPDKLLQDYRSVECHCCQRHFGFQSRAKKDVMYCSFNCLGKENSGEVSSQLTNGDGGDAVDVLEARKLKTATASNIKSHGDVRTSSQGPGELIKTATNVKGPGNGSGRGQHGDTVDGEMLKTADSLTNRGSAKALHEEPVKPPRMQPSMGSAPSSKEEKPLPGEKNKEPPQVIREPTARPKAYNPFMAEVSRPVRPKPKEAIDKLPSPAVQQEKSAQDDMEEYQEIAKVARTPTVETFTISKDSPSGPLTVPKNFPSKLVYENTKVSGLSDKLKWGKLELNVKQIVQVSHTNSSRDFYIQTYQISQMADILLDEIFEALSKPIQRVPLKNYKIGALCLAPFQENYYRAEIIGIGAQVPPMYTVFFCDYGNEETVDGSIIYELNDKLAVMERCTINCVWDMAVAEELGEEEMMAVLESKEGLPIVAKQMIAEGQYLVSVQSFTPRSHLELAPRQVRPVEAETGELVIPIPKKPTPRQDLNAGLVTLPVEPKPVGPKKWNIKTCQYSSKFKDGANVRIAFVWNMNRYLLNAIEDEAKCEEVQDMIESGTYEPLKGIPEIGDILLGLYEGSYYRGQVAELKDGKAHLEFIDYGDKIAVKWEELRLPNEELMKFPIYGMSVVLDGVGEEPRGGVETTPEINKICGGAELRVEFKSQPGNNARVALWTPDKSLNSLIKTLFAAQSGKK